MDCIRKIKLLEASSLPWLRFVFPAYVFLIIVLSLISPGESMAGVFEFDKVLHFGAYALMMLLGLPLFPSVFRRSALLFFVIGLGILMEWCQSMTATRSASGLDILANSAGAITALLIYLSMDRVEAGRKDGSC